MSKEKFILGKHGKKNDGRHDGLASNIRRELNALDHLQTALDDLQDIEWSKTLIDILPIGSPLRVWHEKRLAHWSKTFSDPSLTSTNKP